MPHLTPQKLIWTSDEFKHHERGIGWYTGLFLFGAVLIIWGLYTNNIILTILFILIVFLAYSMSHRGPQRMFVEVDYDGVKMNDVFYPYRNLKCFWLIKHDDGTLELIIETKSLLNRHITVQLEGVNQDSVRLFLKEHIDEVEDYEENFIDFLVRKLKL